MPLAKEKCEPCRCGVGKLDQNAVATLLREVPNWRLHEAPPAPATLERKLSFADFKAAMAFVNRMAEVAEAEGHHPDFAVHYKVVDVSLSTHDVGGLSRNDFILAAKIDQLAG